MTLARHISRGQTLTLSPRKQVRQTDGRKPDARRTDQAVTRANAWTKSTLTACCEGRTTSATVLAHPRGKIQLLQQRQGPLCATSVPNLAKLRAMIDGQLGFSPLVKRRGHHIRATAKSKTVPGREQARDCWRELQLKKI